MFHARLFEHFNKQKLIGKNQSQKNKKKLLIYNLFTCFPFLKRMVYFIFVSFVLKNVVSCYKQTNKQINK